MQSNSKKMTLGIILLVLGFISISVGIIYIKKSNQPEPTTPISAAPTTTPEIMDAPKNDDSEKEKGEAFEKFVVRGRVPPRGQIATPPHRHTSGSPPPGHG